MSESGPGKVYLFNDFFNGINQAGVADNSTTPGTMDLGDFQFFGDGTIEIDAGAIPQDMLSGVVRLTTTNVDKNSAVIGTPKSWDVGLMGTLVFEARVQMNNLATKTVFFGLSDVVTNTISLEDDILSDDGATTLTLTASDLVGFYFSAELTATTSWHTVFNGGSATGVTDSTAIVQTPVAVAAEWQVLRFEIDTNGTVRWYINDMGTPVRTTTGAVSTTTDMGLLLMVEAKGNFIEELDVDYLLAKGNRDWTV